MPLDHSHATATVSITGLALGCYNRSTSELEVGFIRHPKHTLTIKVQTEAENEPPLLNFVADQNQRIFIETERGIIPSPLFHTPTPPEDFDRTAPGLDQEDFQWIVDLEKELNGDDEVNLIPPPFPVTETFISKPFLYADNQNFADGDLNRVNLDNPSEVELFGQLSEVIKGDITCDEGGAVILRVEGPRQLTLRLPRVAGTTYRIMLDNTCPDPPIGTGQPGDFAIYYSLVESTGGKRFFFRLVEPDVHNPDGTCNGSFLGTRGRLFPLPNPA